MLSRIIARLDPYQALDLGSRSDDIDDGFGDQATPPSAEKGVSMLEIAAHENLPIGLTKELIESIEQISAPPGVRDPVGLVRDDQAVGDGGVRWYRDIISGWEL
jgi:ESCRT-II complex subunit VPS36